MQVEDDVHNDNNQSYVHKRTFILTRFWKTDHIITCELNKITMFMHL